MKEYDEDDYYKIDDYNNIEVHVECAFLQVGVIPEDKDFQEIYDLLGSRSSISFSELLEIVDDYVITMEVDYDRKFKKLK